MGESTTAMANPWDIPPFPSHGDADADETYKGVGSALSEWGELEYQLSHIYSHLLEMPSKISAMRQYGVPRILICELPNWKKPQQHFSPNTHINRLRASSTA
jgi:hypothetical protein